MKDLTVIVLAAGKGTRMKSSLPKVLHEVAGKKMINMVIDTAKTLVPKNLFVVVSEDLQFVEENILKGCTKSRFIVQKDKRGTGHAVEVALNDIKKKKENLGKNVLILYGDVPLIKEKTLHDMYEKISQKECGITVLAFYTNDITQKYGRLLIRKNLIEEIIEYKDATEEEKKIALCNSGIMIVNGDILPKLLDKVDNKNANSEYYLTDIIKIAKEMGLKSTFIEAEEDEVMGINSKINLASAEKVVQNRLREKFMSEGITFIDIDTVYLKQDTEIGKDVTVYPNVFFGNGVKIKNNVVIKPFSHLEGCTIEEGASIGPFARIRTGTHIDKNARVGNFVEIKNSKIESKVKVGHLSYIGDSEVGENTNIGAGTITCNYDGINKNKTVIGKNAFIGSNTALVAPVTVGDGAIVGAGSTITKNVSKDALAVARAEQVEIKGLGKKKLCRKK